MSYIKNGGKLIVDLDTGNFKLRRNSATGSGQNTERVEEFIDDEHLESNKELKKISYNEINKISDEESLENNDKIEVIKLSQNIKSDINDNNIEKSSNNFAFSGLIVFSLILAGLFGFRYGKKYLKKEHGII